MSATPNPKRALSRALEAAAEAARSPSPPALVRDPARFSFCESVFAGATSLWHIRPLTVTRTPDGSETVAAKKFSGGIDTACLCGRVRPPRRKKGSWDFDGFGGWDLQVDFAARAWDPAGLYETAARGCVDAYLALPVPPAAATPSPGYLPEDDTPAEERRRAAAGGEP